MAIKFYFDYSDGNFHFGINSKGSIHFSHIIALFKKYHFDFEPLSKTWFTKSAIQASTIIDDLKAYDTIDATDSDYSLLEDFIYPIENSIKKVKIPLDDEYFIKHPPLIGKPNYETFQLDAIRRAVTQNKVILDISMGHGKSFIFSAALYHLMKKGLVDKCLIICRLEGMENIKLEMLKFMDGLLTEDDFAIVDTDHREIEDYFNKKVIITNYVTFRLTGKYYDSLRVKRKKGEQVKKPKKPVINFSSWGDNRLLLLDESQEVNNHDSLQSHFIQLYASNFSRIINMSGSLGYKFLHYYSHCKILIPETVPYSFSEWTSYVANKGTYFSDFAISDFKEHKIKEFKEKVLDKIQVTYRNCIELPENKEEVIYVRMNDKLKKIYRSFLDSEIEKIKHSRGEKGKDITGNDLKNRFGSICQVASDPILLPPEQRIGWKFTDSPKVEVLKSLLEKYVEEDNQKVVIWSVHPKILNELKEVLKKYNPIIIHGDKDTSVDTKDRIAEIKKFQTDKNIKVALLSYVMSTSINLVEATRQIYFDLPLDSDDFNQSKARIHRQGQQNKVITNYLQYNNSVDIYVWEEILMAKDKTKNILSSKESLSLEDYKNIFNRSKSSYLTKVG